MNPNSNRFKFTLGVETRTMRRGRSALSGRIFLVEALLFKKRADGPMNTQSTICFILTILSSLSTSFQKQKSGRASIAVCLIDTNIDARPIVVTSPSLLFRLEHEQHTVGDGETTKDVDCGHRNGNRTENVGSRTLGQTSHEHTS